MTKQGSRCYSLKEEDKNEKEEVNASLANAKDFSVDVAVAAVSPELDGIFFGKKEVFPVLPRGFGRRIVSLCCHQD